MCGRTRSSTRGAELTTCSWSRAAHWVTSSPAASPDDVDRLRAELTLELEAFRSPHGIRLERYLVFATGRRPA